jgi:hypothetical protein
MSVSSLSNRSGGKAGSRQACLCLSLAAILLSQCLFSFVVSHSADDRAITFLKALIFDAPLLTIVGLLELKRIRNTEAYRSAYFRRMRRVMVAQWQNFDGGRRFVPL